MTVIHTTPAQREALRQRLADTLLAPEVARIRFRYGSFQLRRGGFDVIAASLATRGVGSDSSHRSRRPMNVRVETLPPGVGAEYHGRDNCIVVPTVDFGRTMVHRAALVHETVHAIFDYNRHRLTALEEEACAYIAGAMYRLIFSEPLSTTAPIWSESQRIAETLVAPHRLMFPLTDEVSAADMQRLVAAVRADPVYSGIASRRATYRYRHDGGTI